ncbi:MAG: hypothetical protein JWP12_1336 [Bacteroidetes bacterium]|nr:hypothetical protein [Bacteroidota bacterium]
MFSFVPFVVERGGAHISMLHIAFHFSFVPFVVEK